MCAHLHVDRDERSYFERRGDLNEEQERMNVL
jgi:hypothetical protein